MEAWGSLSGATEAPALRIDPSPDGGICPRLFARCDCIACRMSFSAPQGPSSCFQGMSCMINFYKGRSQPVKSVRIAVFEGYLGFSFLMSDRYRQTPPNDRMFAGSWRCCGWISLGIRFSTHHITSTPKPFSDIFHRHVNRKSGIIWRRRSRVWCLLPFYWQIGRQK
jgi:hypothetical protein